MGDDPAYEELKTLLRVRIDSALAGNISPRSMDDILEEELERFLVQVLTASR